jgi:hypothetical protein
MWNKMDFLLSRATFDFLVFFWYFWLAIQNTANRQMRDLFYLLAVFISFPLARAAAAVAAADFSAAAARPDPTPPPFVWGEGSTKKNKIACSVGVGCWA